MLLNTLCESENSSSKIRRQWLEGKQTGGREMWQRAIHDVRPGETSA